MMGCGHRQHQNRSLDLARFLNHFHPKLSKNRKFDGRIQHVPVLVFVSSCHVSKVALINGMLALTYGNCVTCGYFLAEKTQFLSYSLPCRSRLDYAGMMDR